MRPFYFAIFAPAMVLVGLTVGIGNDAPTITGRFMTYVTSATCLLIPLGLANPRRFWWALRIVAGVMCAACLNYLWTRGVCLAGWQAVPPWWPGAKNLRGAAGGY